jgi:LuxR family maltose regulon positive regulatory protein
MRGQAATVLGWIKALPDELVRARPQLCIAYAAALTIIGQLDHVEAYLQQAERSVESLEPASERKAVLSRVSAVRAYLAVSEGDLDRAMDLAEKAAQPLAPDDVFFRGIVSWLQGMTQYFGQGAAAARHKFAETARLSREAGSTLMTLLSVYASGFLCIIQGHLHQARETFEEGLDLAEAEGIPREPSGSKQPSLGASLMYQGLGEVAREQNDLVRAERYLARSVALAEQWGNAETLADSYALYGRVRHAMGDLSGAHGVMDKALQLGQKGRISDLTIRQMEAHQARLWIAGGQGVGGPVVGDLEAASHWAEAQQRDRASERAAEGQFVLYVRGLEERLLAQWYIARGEHERALDLLASHQATLEASGWTGIVIETLALQALALDGQGRTEEALETLGRALSLAQPEGYVRVFVDHGSPMERLVNQVGAFLDSQESAASDAMRAYVAGLLRAFVAPDPGSQVPDSERATDDSTWPEARNVRPEAVLLDPLTDRELQVLYLLAGGLSNREIAQRLTIALGTAKRHVSNIYAKLDVHSRVQAAARARALHLV